MVFRDASTDHYRAGLLRCENDIREFLLVLHYVHIEIGVLLFEQPELRAKGAIHDARNIYWNLVFGRPVQNRLLVANPGAELVCELPAR